MRWIPEADCLIVRLPFFLLTVGFKFLGPSYSTLYLSPYLTEMSVAVAETYSWLKPWLLIVVLISGLLLLLLEIIMLQAERVSPRESSIKIKVNFY